MEGSRNKKKKRKEKRETIDITLPLFLSLKGEEGLFKLPKSTNIRQMIVMVFCFFYKLSQRRVKSLKFEEILGIRECTLLRMTFQLVTYSTQVLYITETNAHYVKYSLYRHFYYRQAEKCH